MNRLETGFTGANSSQQFDRHWIAERIPHQGAMCLLHQVESFSQQTLRCTARSHRELDNPLRADGRLAAVCGIEYAAQAMALHPALLIAEHSLSAAPIAARSGFLASVRSCVLQVSRLDDIADDLLIEINQFSGDGDHVLYEFTLQAGSRLLVQGRAAVILDAASLLNS